MFKVLRAVGAAAAVLSPILVYLALTRFGVRAAGLMVAGGIAAAIPFRAQGARGEHLRRLLGLPLGLIAVALVSAMTSDRRVLMAMPAVSNVVLLVSFASSLRGMPIVERFARTVDPDVWPSQVVYCRTLTILWSIFFAVNALVIAGLGLFAPLEWWALYSGAIAYGLVGALISVEYVVRRIRFRKYVANPFDRALARLFPGGSLRSPRIPPARATGELR